ncbi:RNA-directed DNA polymerase [Gregarina niphandrodes]|uniref:RNA-directed DNA polymerase n=1 Tax=Gregarina niphandrodes TaxID=110365 RepID=A0A023AXU4_GRENI|nr:RNA-directed DNA polymerase [Gregarina niphandrodes]EZG43476.1 RNA-directed DNA polymerase [Gregarina niphandrodes]|eukprot:XP_011133294.1 RNA-directed DNA polymerase [Gregarina niphandrodes]
MNSGFWNVPVEEGCKALAAFITPTGLFEFNIIPLGIKNSPAEFQRAMDSCFAPLLGENAFCYIDDIVICGQDFDSVLRRVELFLEQCRKTGFYLRLDKSEWFKDEVKYLGHVVGRTGIKVQEKKSRAIVNAPASTNKKELQSFLGMCGYLRPFTPPSSHTSRRRYSTC